MLHEVVRYELPQAVLAPRAPARSRLRAGGSSVPRARRGLRRGRCLLRVCAEPPDRVDELTDALSGRRHRLDDGWPPLGSAERLERQVRLNGGDEPIRALPVRLVDDED